MTTTSTKPGQDEEPLTVEKLMADIAKIKATLGPPLPRVRLSRHATGLPMGKPFCDDTREMVEHFLSIGLVQRVPTAFMFDGNLVIHPDLAAKAKVKP